MVTPKLAAMVKPVQFGLVLASVLLAWACSSQEPAFTEDRSIRMVNGDDATAANGTLSLPPESSATAVANGGGTSAVVHADGDDGDVDGDGHDADGNGPGGNGTGGNGGNNNGGDTGGGIDAGGDDAGGTDAGSDAGGTGTGNGGTGTGGTGTGGTGTGNGGSGNEGGIGNATWRTVDIVQQGPGKVDILWVVDNSSSMSEEQTYLANNFNAMINQLSSAGHNFQTAVTTTDACQDTLPPALEDRACPVDYGGTAATHLRGLFRGVAGRKVLKQGDSDIVQRFNEYTSPGTDGSGFEHGLYAAKLAVDKVIAGQNENLVRGDAFLAVIVVSDEEDDGIGLSLTDAYNGHNFWNEGLTRFRFTEDNLISYLRNVKGEGNFSISAIAPTRKNDGSLCSAPHTQPLEEGTQYIKAAQKSGGIIQSICETNWNTSLANIGVDLNAQLTQVVLPSTPDVATIQVKVNGVQTASWTYNAGNNAVKFNNNAVPAEGAQIKVTYREMP